MMSITHSDAMAIRERSLAQGRVWHDTSSPAKCLRNARICGKVQEVRVTKSSRSMPKAF